MYYNVVNALKVSAKYNCGAELNMPVKCENFLCIYNDRENCMLKNVSLDIIGTCRECIYPEIPPEFLEKIKKEKLERL